MAALKVYLCQSALAQSHSQSGGWPTSPICGSRRWVAVRNAVMDYPVTRVFDGLDAEPTLEWRLPRAARCPRLARLLNMAWACPSQAVNQSRLAASHGGTSRRRRGRRIWDGPSPTGRFEATSSRLRMSPMGRQRSSQIWSFLKRWTDDMQLLRLLSNQMVKNIFRLHTVLLVLRLRRADRSCATLRGSSDRQDVGH